MDELIIRAPHQDDIPGLTALMNLPGVRRGTARLPYTRQETIRQRIFEAGPNLHILVGVIGDQLVAQVGLTQRIARQAHCGEIFLAVHDDHTGQGIGRRMMEGMLDLADNWLGLVRVQLDVDIDNAPAIRVYESVGFEREGTLRAFILREGVLIDAYIMGRLRPAPQRKGWGDSPRGLPMDQPARVESEAGG